MPVSFQKVSQEDLGPGITFLIPVLEKRDNSITFPFQSARKAQVLNILIHYAISYLFLVPEPFLMFFLQCKCAGIEADRMNCFKHLSHGEWGSIGDWFNVTPVEGGV